MYIEREIESTVDAMLRQGKVVLVTGARQVGKTTMLRRHLGDSFAYATMDDARDRALAKQDAALFFDSKTLVFRQVKVDRKFVDFRHSRQSMLRLTGSAVRSSPFRASTRSPSCSWAR